MKQAYEQSEKLEIHAKPRPTIAILLDRRVGLSLSEENSRVNRALAGVVNQRQGKNKITQFLRYAWTGSKSGRVEAFKWGESVAFFFEGFHPRPVV